MRIASLGSGSRGNGTLIEQGDTCLLVDCGFTLKETERRLAQRGKEPRQITAILVTHEHQDHIGGVGPLARKYAIPVWMTPGTQSCARTGELPLVSLINCHQDFDIRDVLITPYPVPHDAREPCQFIFSNGSRRIGLLTDAGRSTPHIEAQLDGCDALMLECNHDVRMLASGPYPPSLKERVGGELGHLSNDQTAAIVSRVNVSRLQHMIAAHLSEKNNAPDLARTALAQALGCSEDWITLAGQQDGLGWRAVV